jgi:hypothetical protein
VDTSLQAVTSWSPQEERAALQRQLRQLKLNLMEVRQRRVEFVDPRNAPLDLKGAERRIQDEITQVETRLAELGRL